MRIGKPPIQHTVVYWDPPYPAAQCSILYESSPATDIEGKGCPRHGRSSKLIECTVQGLLLQVHAMTSEAPIVGRLYSLDWSGLDWSGVEWTGLTQKSVKCLFQCRTEAKHTYSVTRYRIIVEFRVRVSSSSFEFEFEFRVRVRVRVECPEVGFPASTMGRSTSLDSTAVQCNTGGEWRLLLGGFLEVLFTSTQK